ncbi:MAG: HlyD family secretion protein [Chitinophagaceae bacterium]
MSKLTGLLMFLFFLMACSSEIKTKKENTPANKDSLVKPDINQVAGTGRIEPETGITDLASDNGGLIIRIFIKEGEVIKKDMPLIQLDNSVQSSQVDEARARLTTQQQQLQLDRVKIDEARNNLLQSEADYNRTKRLVEKKAETQQQLDNAKTDQENKRLAVKNAEAALELTQKKISESGTQVNTARATQGKSIIRAPQNGRLLEVSARVGASLTPGQRYAQLAPEGRLTALCEIDELFADEIKIGQQAFIRYKGYPDTVSKGSVLYTAPYLKKKSLFSDEVGTKEDRRVREVRILLDNQELLINRQVECIISVK